MPYLKLDHRTTCPVDDVELERQKTVTYPDQQYDVYQCPVCQTAFALNWHRLGEPQQVAAVVAA